MIHILIDGYNYISSFRSEGLAGGTSLELLRGILLNRLVKYRKQRPIRITVVFDAYRSLSLGRQTENFKGVEVVYSGENETADDVIIGVIEEGRSGIMVCSADRAIIDAAKRRGVPFVTPGKLETAMAAAGMREDRGDESSGPVASKRGNPRKLPKRLRRATRAIDKIRS